MILIRVKYWPHGFFGKIGSSRKNKHLLYMSLKNCDADGGNWTSDSASGKRIVLLGHSLWLVLQFGGVHQVPRVLWKATGLSSQIPQHPAKSWSILDPVDGWWKSCTSSFCFLWWVDFIGGDLWYDIFCSMWITWDGWSNQGASQPIGDVHPSHQSCLQVHPFHLEKK